jgi:hypothetical protein
MVVAVIAVSCWVYPLDRSTAVGRVGMRVVTDAPFAAISPEKSRVYAPNGAKTDAA